MEGPVAIRRCARAVLLAAALLLAFGWAVIWRSEQLTDGQTRLMRQQVVWSAAGMIACLGVSSMDYRRFILHRLAICSIVILGLVAVYGFPAVNGAHRWVRVGGIGIQPSEFAKLAFIIALAGHLMHRDAASGFAEGVLWPLSMAVLPMLLILKEPDLGTSLVFLPILFAMLFAAGARHRDLIRLAVAGIMLLPLLWSQMSHEQRSRVTALWEQNAPREAPTADGFHLDQAKRMFALGGVWGSFFDSEVDEAVTHDDSSMYGITGVQDSANANHRGSPALPSCRVPEPHTDSVYCVIGERFGLAGAGVVLLVYAVLVGGCLRVAGQTDESFGRLVAVGVATLFAAEVLINTAMMVGLLPITGLSLPLISYGGSNLTAHLVALGLVISIDRRRV